MSRVSISTRRIALTADKDGPGGFFIEGSVATPSGYGGFPAGAPFAPAASANGPSRDASLLSEDMDTDVKEPV